MNDPHHTLRSDVGPAETLAPHLDTTAWPDPAFDHAPLGVRLRFTAPSKPVEPDGTDDPGRPAAPLAVSLVIDRSSSMSGRPVAAARTAAILLQEQLADRDFRGVVAFDDRIETVVPLGSLDRATPEGRRRFDEARTAIEMITSRGYTALTDGWRHGAHALEQADLPADTETLCVVLSDGMGNRGVTNPNAMRRLAAASASWGVRTTCVGIGARYSTPQLEALSDGGEGSLHQASTPEEIVECVLGELGRVRSVSARATELTVVVPNGLGITVVGGRSHEIDALDRATGTRTVRIRLGDIAGGATVDVGLLLTRFGRTKHATELHFPPIMARATWSCAVTGESHAATLDAIPLPTGVRPVTGDRDRDRDRDLATGLARLWHATIIRTASLLNEDRRYHEAGDEVERVWEAFDAFCRGLPDSADLVRTLRATERRSRGRWEGRSKKEMMIQARKMTRGERDPRAGMDVAHYAKYVERQD